MSSSIQKKNLKNLKFGYLRFQELAENHPLIQGINIEKNEIDFYYATSSLGTVPFNFIYDFITSIYPCLHKSSKSYIEKYK